MGNLGGGPRAIPARDWALSPVADRDRRLLLDAVRGSIDNGCPGRPGGGSYSSSSSSSWTYGFVMDAV